VARVRVGEAAPDFTLPWTGEGEFSLSANRGRWVVLAFYPGDFTPTCTKQFCNYRDARDQIDDLDAEVVGISPQDVASHERFIAEHGLTLPLAADVDKSVAKAYGALGPGGFVRRAIFVIDPDGVIRHRRVALVGLGFEDADDLRSALDGARAAA
jgi:peroxiredoxin Q/BCP